MPSVSEARPPYVKFELRPEEDRAASIAAGHFVAKDVTYAVITPMGSKDRIECIAAEWFEQLAKDTEEGRFPREWYKAFKSHFKDWEEGNEPCTDGTPIAQWPPLSPAQLRMCKEVHIRSVEDLAAANEETLSRLGMGGRALKDKAKEWLDTSKNIGQSSERIAALEATNNTLQEQIRNLEARLKKSEAPQK